MDQILKKIATVFLAAIMMVTFMPALPQAQAMAKAKAPARVKITKAEARGNSLYIKWKKAKGAKKYQIYVKAGKSRKFKKYATVKKPQTYRIKNLKWKTRYQVKVRAVNGKKKGKWSTVYQYKFGKKITLQSIARDPKEMAAMEKYEQSLEEAFDDLFDAEIRFKKNTMFMELTGTVPFTPEQVANLSDQFAEECEKKSFRSDMKKTIQQLEYDTGLSGCKITLMFMNSDGSVIYSRTY